MSVTRYLSDHEEARLLSVLTGPRADLLPVVILAIHTGMRRGERLSLRWANVDFVRGSNSRDELSARAN
jgi:integrase